MRNSIPEDLISDLPDHILISIISLLPTKEALRTPTFSKRWSDLFRLTPAVSFSTKCKAHLNFPCTCNSDEFIDRVCKVLHHRSAHVLSFDFDCCLPESCTPAFERCLNSLVGLGIRKLRLRLPRCTEEFEFPLHILPLMKSLQYFELSCLSSLPALKNQCNSLETIKLTKVSASPGFLESILSNCSSLCTLTLKGCNVPSKLCFPRVDLRLQCILIHGCPGLEEIYFYAPNLSTFDLNCQNPVDIIFDYIPQLQSVYLTSKSEHVPYFCRIFAEHLPSLKTLFLGGIEDLYKDESIATGINMLSNLKRLELSVYTNNCNLFSLSRVLGECPRLEELQLATMASFYKWPKDEKPVIVHYRLKVVEISGFTGSESEVGFVVYILKSAVDLHRMIISRYTSLHMGCGDWVDTEYPRVFWHEWRQLFETFEQMKREAVSKTLQLVIGNFRKKAKKRNIL